MILTIFLTLLGISFALIALSFYSQQAFLRIVGFSILFFLGLVVMNTTGPLLGTDGIQYKTGENTTYTYNTNSTTIATTTQVDNTATYSNLIYGFILAITSFFLIILIIFDPKVKLA